VAEVKLCNWVAASYPPALYLQALAALVHCNRYRPVLYYFLAISEKQGIVWRYLKKGICTKCLANSSYVVLPSEIFHPLRIEAAI
jgi:hypothetical protein